jgi:hypothetical protein
VFLLRDLTEDGPQPTASIAELSEDRLEAHFAWRSSRGLVHEAEFLRAGVHLGHLGEWLDEHCGATTGATKVQLREVAADRFSKLN